MEQALKDYIINIPDTLLLYNEPMSRHTSFRIGGPAAVFIKAYTKDAVINIQSALLNLGATPLIIGNGSNILVSDSGINGVVMKFCGGECRVNGTSIYADAGVTLKQLALTARDAGLSGLEFAHGIPGSVGGAVYMNAGAFGGEIKDVITDSEYIDNSAGVKRLEKNEHQFGYRDSFYKKNRFTILRARFELKTNEKALINAKMKEYIECRKAKQPLEFPSAGSVFKRPEGGFAGKLIEESGLKGYAVGGAEVSEKHAGFIINRGGATCEDVLRLIEYIQETVLKRTGFLLECEIMKI